MVSFNGAKFMFPENLQHSGDRKLDPIFLASPHLLEFRKD